MAGGWQQKKSTWDPTIVSAKDHIMASENALTAAIATLNLQFQLASLTGEAPSVTAAEVVEQTLKLAEKYYDEHMARGGNVQSAANNVVRQFPGAKAEEEKPADRQSTPGGPGGVTVKLKKHAGKTLAQVYDEDPSYVRNFLASPDFSNEWLRDKAQAFLAGVDAAADEDDPYAN